MQYIYLGMVLGSTSKGMGKSIKGEDKHSVMSEILLWTPGLRFTRVPYRGPCSMNLWGDWRWTDLPTHSFPSLGARALHSQRFQAALCWASSQSKRAQDKKQREEELEERHRQHKNFWPRLQERPYVGCRDMTASTMVFACMQALLMVPGMQERLNQAWMPWCIIYERIQNMPPQNMPLFDYF